MRLKPLILVPAAAAALALAGCASDDAGSADTSTGASAAESAQAAESAAPSCPTEAPAETTQADWTLDGQQGSIEVVAPTADNAPLITVDGPFTVAETTVETLNAGDGAQVSQSSRVSVCYQGVNGRDGSVFDSAYERGAPAQFAASGVVPGFRDALSGQQAGATVAVAIPSSQGYPEGTPDGSIKPGDSIIFALQILDVQ